MTDKKNINLQKEGGFMELIVIGIIAGLGAIIAKETAPVLKPVPVKNKK